MSLIAARLLLADALGCAPEEISPDADIGTMSGWDSIAHMRIVLAIEGSRGEQLDSEEILQATSLIAIAKLLQRRPTAR